MLLRKGHAALQLDADPEMHVHVVYRGHYCTVQSGTDRKEAGDEERGCGIQDSILGMMGNLREVRPDQIDPLEVLIQFLWIRVGYPRVREMD